MSSRIKPKSLHTRVNPNKLSELDEKDPPNTMVSEQKNHPRVKIPESPSEETLLPDRTAQDYELIGGQGKLDLTLTSKTVLSSLLCAEAIANISVTCVNCASQGKGPWERPWHGIIQGRRTYGCIKALLVRIKLKHANAPLVGLLTICSECCTELKLHDQSDQMDQILKFHGSIPGKIIFPVLYKEMEELFFSRVIVLTGMFTTPFLTIGSDGQWKEWNQTRDG